MGRIVTHIPETTDLSLITLKGHLIMEEELNKALKVKTPYPEHIDKAGLKFNQLLQLNKSLYFKQSMSWVWGAASKLNSIRNDYSHSLVPENGGVKVVEFIELVEAHSGTVQGDSFESYRRAIAMVCAELHQLHSPIRA
jgi:hypothetical protein